MSQEAYHKECSVVPLTRGILLNVWYVTGENPARLISDLDEETRVLSWLKKRGADAEHDHIWPRLQKIRFIS